MKQLKLKPVHITIYCSFVFQVNTVKYTFKSEQMSILQK